MADSDSTEETEIVRHISIQELSPHFPTLVIDSFLAEGGMGAVYRAKQRELDRDVALKLISHAWSENGKELEMFRKEARLMARLSHPNLVQIFDFGSVEELDIVYFLMEYVHGETLHSYIYRTKLSPEQAVSLMTEVATAIEYAHGEGVWHHDIKPGNIMLTPEGRVKVLDFGLAKLANETIAAEGERFGTPDYAAPEVYYEGETPDHRSDIFSLGAVLYELLAGEVPGKHYKHASQKVGAPPHLDRVVARSLAHDPEARYGSVTEWLQDLKGGAITSVAPSRLQTALRSNVQAGTLHPSVAPRGPRGPQMAPRKRVAMPSVAKSQAPRVSVGTPGATTGNVGGVVTPPRPTKSAGNAWVFPVVLVLAAVLGTVVVLSIKAKDRAAQAAARLAPPVAEVPQAPKPNKLNPTPVSPDLAAPVATIPDPGPESVTNPVSAPKSVPSPPPSTTDLPELSLPLIASGEEAELSLGGPLNDPATVGANLASEPWTAVLRFEAIPAQAGKAHVLLEFGGAGAGVGLFLAPVNGVAQVVLGGKHQSGPSFGLAQSVVPGEEVTFLVAHQPGAEGSTFAFQQLGGQPIVKKTELPQWIDSDAVNGFGTGSGRDLGAIGGADIVFGPAFQFVRDPASLPAYPGPIEWRLHRGQNLIAP